jgi:hypothetical protein
VEKKQFIEELKRDNQYVKEDIEDEEEDLTGSVWLPVIIENKIEKGTNDKIMNDPSIKEIDLAEISEKEVFVRKADLVKIYSLSYHYI